MKLLFDTQIFDWQINGGISRYFVELFQRLEQHSDIELQFECKHSYNTYLQNTKWLKYQSKFENFNFKGKLSIAKKINQLINRSFSNQHLIGQSFELFHPTYYDPYFLNSIGNKPFILTVHDLTIEKFNDNSTLTKKVKTWKKELIAKAAHIISVSENTKCDIVSHYHIVPSKITTIYLAGGFEFDLTNKKENDYSTSVNYILYVGSRNTYKNFNQFLIEIAVLLNKHNLKLVIAGGGALNLKEVSLINSLNITEKVQLHSQVSDMELASLYVNAMVFVFPSLYEGFGIPVLEAMQCGCPTLLSNNSSLPEVGGEAAFYFNPFEKGDLNMKLEKLILDNVLREEMKAKGLEQSLKFSWQNTANEHITLYKKLMDTFKN